MFAQVGFDSGSRSGCGSGSACGWYSKAVGAGGKVKYLASSPGTYSSGSSGTAFRRS